MEPNDGSLFSLILKELMESMRLTLTKIDAIRNDMVSRNEIDAIQGKLDSIQKGQDARIDTIEETQKSHGERISTVESKQIPWYIIGLVSAVLTFLSTIITFALVGDAHFHLLK